MIYVLRDGKVAEKGKHFELIAKRGFVLFSPRLLDLPSSLHRAVQNLLRARRTAVAGEDRLIRRIFAPQFRCTYYRHCAYFLPTF